MSRASLEQWLQRLESIHPREIELGLDRVRAVAHRLKLLPVPQPVVTVAGTNGKGSTVAVLESLLRECGYRTGAFISPHLLRFNERIRIDGIDAPDAAIIDALEAIDQARGETSLTYFEFATLAALWVFKSQALDVIVLEVGLGGRLDAVNIVDPAVAVITSIDLDHQAWLGDTRGAIAREKAGIMRAAKPVVIADPAPPDELALSVAAVGAQPALFLGRELTIAVEHGTWQGSVTTTCGQVRLLERMACGALLPENVCAAVQAAALLDVEFSDDDLRRALARGAPPARRQLRRLGGYECVLDVAHNPASVRKLLEYLLVTDCKKKTMCIFSAMADKDVEGMVSATNSYFDGWFLADQPGNARAASAADIAAILHKAGQAVVSISENLCDAFRHALSIAAPGDRLVVFGSFSTVAAIAPLLDKDDNRHGTH